MVRKFDCLPAFYRAYGSNTSCTLEDVNALILALQDKAVVRIYPDDSVVVREISDRHFPQKKYHQQRYTKLAASLDRDLVASFSTACSLLHISQASLLSAFLKEVIRCSHSKIDPPDASQLAAFVDSALSSQPF
jgi:hypothetical protein